MYNYIAIILCIIFVIISLINTKVLIKNLASPLLIFGILWGGILFLNSLQLFNLNLTDNKVYLIILVGIIAFGIGYLIVYLFRKKYRLVFNSRIKSINSNSYKDYFPRYKLLCFIGFICIVYYFKNFITVLNLLLQGNDLSNIRSMAQDPNSILNIRSNIENAFRILIILPLSMALEPIVAVDFWIGKRHKPLLIICIIIITLRVITDGGRTPIVNFMIYMIIAYILSTWKDKSVKTQSIINKNKRLYLIIGVILGAVILYNITLSRAGENALKTTYYYFAMEPYMLDTWAKEVEFNQLIGYGMGSMNGFIFPILYIIKNFLGVSFPEYWLKIYDIILLTDSKWKFITNTGVRANAYVSMFWFFYLDGRVFGVILGMLLYGMIVCNSYISAIKYNTSKNICLYALIYQGLFFSFIRFPFTNMYYALALLFILLVAYKPIRIINNNEIQ